jgi:hypothetical protein
MKHLIMSCRYKGITEAIEGVDKAAILRISV